MSTFHYFAFPPSEILAPFIELIWGVRGSTFYFQEAILPNGVIELMINFGPTQKVLAYGDQAVDQSFNRFWLAGNQERALTIASPGGADHMGVRFRPGGAHAFFAMPMSEVTNSVVDLDLIIGDTAAGQLRDRLGMVNDDRERCRAVESWLLERRYAVHPYFATTRRAIDMLQGSSFRMGITEMCERLGLSNRHLIAQFRDIVGYAPKTMSRVSRFHAVINAVRGVNEPDWAALAYKYNYSDQAHLIREFRHFSNVTPTEFIQRRSPDHVHVIVDEHIE